MCVGTSGRLGLPRVGGGNDKFIDRHRKFVFGRPIFRINHRYHYRVHGSAVGRNKNRYCLWDDVSCVGGAGGREYD